VTTPSRRCRTGARSWLRHLVDDLVYGQRGDPLAVVRQLVNQQVATATDVNETLPASLAVIIADTLRLDHVAYLVLLDLHLPDKSGLDVNRLLAATTPTSRSSCSPCQKTTTRQSQRYATVPAGTSSKARPDSHRTRHRLGDGRRRRPRPRRRAGHGRARPAPRRDRVIAIPTIEPPRGRHLGADRPRPRQPDHRTPTRSHPENRSQPRVQRPRQAQRSPTDRRRSSSPTAADSGGRTSAGSTVTTTRTSTAVDSLASRGMRPAIQKGRC
jgi:hypothetical protein